MIMIAVAVCAVALGRSPREVRLAVRALSERAMAGDAKSLYDLARLHDYGYDSVPVDSARSTALYRMSAERGYAPAQSYLGFRYFTGEAAPLLRDSAIFWFEKAVAAGDPRAANNLGYIILNADSATRDYGKARDLFEMAAAGGLHAAQSQLGDFYRYGLSVKPDTVRAAMLYEDAAKGGVADAQGKLVSMMEGEWDALPADSALQLGMKLKGESVFGVGVYLFGISADKGNPKAMAELGEAYSLGRGVDYNHRKSQEYYLRSALKGYEPARHVIAELLEIFPQSLDEQHLRLILEEHYGADSIPSGISTPSFWYE